MSPPPNVSMSRSHVEKVVNQLDLVRDRKGTSGKVAQKSNGTKDM